MKTKTLAVLLVACIMIISSLSVIFGVTGGAVGVGVIGLFILIMAPLLTGDFF